MSAGRALRVFVEIDAKAPDAACLERLTALGLEIERVIGNKVLGTLDATDRAAVESDPQVRLIEVSRRLRKHRGG